MRLSDGFGSALSVRKSGHSLKKVQNTVQREALFYVSF